MSLQDLRIGERNEEPREDGSDVEPEPLEDDTVNIETENPSPIPRPAS